MIRVADCCNGALAALIARHSLRLRHVDDAAVIPGSYWGDDEAGLIGTELFVRDRTPVHSALHEACHYVCMDEMRRKGLHRDAGGDHAEENAVCYLQILMADHLPEMGRAQMCADMDAWGYTFRLGSAREWFERDADDARVWLLKKAIIDAGERLTWRLRA
jgi:hypothetical protein